MQPHPTDESVKSVQVNQLQVLVGKKSNSNRTGQQRVDLKLSDHSTPSARCLNTQ